MEALFSQLFGEGEGILQMLWFLMFIVFMLFGSKLMIKQTIWKLEKEVIEIEQLAARSRKVVERSISRKSTKSVGKEVRNFMDFFAVPPVSTDPYGVMKKIDLVVRRSDTRFKLFVNQVGKGLSTIEKMNMKNALMGAMTTHQIAKIVRHLLELTRKYKNLQLAMLLQMQFPFIKRAANAASDATIAFVKGIPIGDGIGPLVIANMTPAKARVRIDKQNEFAYTMTRIGGKSVILAKANGPGASTGKPGKFLQMLSRRKRIGTIISVDAAMRMEGEKTGSIAEGVGVAMGGIGIERYAIENFAVSKNIPLDAVAIKVNDKEALQPMKKEVLKAVPAAIEKVREAVRRSRGNILIIGVGNTCGVGNDAKAAKKAEIVIKKNAPKKKKEKKGWF